MRRREKFVLASVFLSLGILILQYIPLEFRFIGVFVFTLLTYAVSAWALYDDLRGVEWLTIIPFPALYSLSVSLFYFLLPTHILSRVFILGLFGVGMYGLYLTCNIYSVAKARTIQLLRAAHAIGLFFTLLISVLISNTIFSFHFPFWLNGVLVGAVHFPLYLMTMWTIKLEPKIQPQTWGLSLFLAASTAELSVMLSFVPVTVWTSALVIGSFLYITVGILQNYLQERLFRNTIREYLIFAALVTVAFVFLVEWK